MKNQDIYLSELNNEGMLSTRTFNVCRQNGLMTINSVLTYFDKYKSFKTLKNCGTKSAEELLIIYDLYQTNIDSLQDFTISKDAFDILKDDGTLSTQGFNVCYYNDLKTFSSILIFYYKNGSFKSLRNCGEKLNQELIKFCEEYKNKLFSSKLLEMQIDKLLETDAYLSRHTLSLCQRNNLTTIKDLYTFFQKNHNESYTYDSKAISEIKAACHNYEIEILSSTQNSSLLLTKIPAAVNKENWSLKIQNLEIQQKSLLNNLIKVKLQTLSTRSYNALSNFLNQDFSITNFDKKIFSQKDFSFDKIARIGEKSVKELNELIKNILDAVELVCNAKSEKELSNSYLCAILLNTFNVLHEDYTTIEAILTKMDRIPIFKTLHVLLNNSYLFNENEQTIFNTCFDYFIEFKHHSLDTIAKEINLSRERVRQIRSEIYDNISKSLDIVKKIELPILLYNIDLEQPYISVNETIISAINNTENANFNLLFINKILSVMVNNTHTLIGNEKDRLFGIKNRNSHYWKQTYLISTEITNIFDFDRCIEDIAKRLMQRIEESYYFKFESYLFEFYTNDKNDKKDFVNKLDLIAEICEKIIFNEFSLILDRDNNLNFERNTYKTISDYVIEIFEEAQKALNIEEVYELFKEKVPHLAINPETVRANCRKNAKLMPISRTSTYILKALERVDDNIKGGAIRDIVEEYLLGSDEPQNVAIIAEYVARFRPTANINSVRTNLKAEEIGRFIFFENNYVGLNNKEYKGWNLSIIEDNDRRSWQDSIKLFEEFINKNKRTPSSSKNEEVKLFRFFYNFEKRYNDNKLAKEQSIEYERLQKLIDSIDNPPKRKK